VSELPNEKICLVDDDPSVLTGLVRLLTSAGWRVQPFGDPAEFLRYACSHQVPVAVLDVGMPVMSGLEVQVRLKQISPGTRVIVFTGRDNPLVCGTAVRGGAAAFFSKPFDDEEFLSAVCAAVTL